MLLQSASEAYEAVGSFFLLSAWYSLIFGPSPCAWQIACRKRGLRA
jgi:hypothetical protein